MDAIVPLFVNNGQNQIGILRSLEKWESPIENNSDAEYFLSQIIWRRVDQTVTKYFKEKDPVFEKILKTLNICIKNNKFKKKRYFGTVYVTQQNSAELNGKIISDEEFNEVPYNLFGLKQVELFNSIFEYLVRETHFYPAIPLNALVRRIKIYYSNSYSQISQTISNSEFYFTYRDMIKEEINSLKQKLYASYVESGKISESNAEKIFQAFQNISNDLLNGGVHSTLYDYLSDFDKQLTKEDFYKNYHHIMHYLLSHLKNSIAEKIKS